MKTHWSIGTIAIALLALSSTAFASGAVTDPITQFYAKRSGVSLRAVVYRPEGWKPREQRPAVVIFHGLGWTKGQPEWSEKYARHYQSKGLVSISAQYRVAEGPTITPVHSIDDARDAIRWVRANSVALGINPQKVAVHGLSTGGHLALAAAMFQGNSSVSPIPNALILYSPAVDIGTNPTFQQLLGEKTPATSVSPMANVRSGLPPTIILQGDSDTVTPFAGAKTFCEKMTAAGNRCELNRYMYVGHLFTPKGTPDDQTPKPDARVEAAALVKADAFLASLGYIK
jgi:acetyl esterase/lipase